MKTKCSAKYRYMKSRIKSECEEDLRHELRKKKNVRVLSWETDKVNWLKIISSVESRSG